MPPVPPKITEAVRQKIGDAAKDALKGGKRGVRGSAEPKQRVITVEQAIKCCELQQDRLLSLISDIALKLLDGDNTKGLAFAPIPVSAPSGVTVARPEIIRLPALGSGPAGAVVIFGAIVLKAIDDAIGIANFAEGLVDMERAIRTVAKTKTKLSGCEDCMFKRALQQQNERTTIKLASGGDIRPRV